VFNLKTIAKTLLELEKDITTTIKVQENSEMLLHYNKNNKSIVLDDMEDLQNGMKIKVSILSSSQPQPITSNFFFIFFLSLFFISFFYFFPFVSNQFENVNCRTRTRTKTEQRRK